MVCIIATTPQASSSYISLCWEGTECGRLHSFIMSVSSFCIF